MEIEIGNKGFIRIRKKCIIFHLTNQSRKKEVATLLDGE